ncbi:zinc-dependent metalloprotease [Cellulomonas soli]
MDGPVDWDAAARLAGRMSPPGPTAGPAQLTELVAELRAGAARTAEHASRASRLVPADGRAPQDVSRVLVVDRPGWARANTQVFAAMLDGVDPAVWAGEDGRAPSLAARAGATAEVAGVLALLSGKVLGQYDPFSARAGEPGRLLLVAPNVLQVERSLDLVPADFRVWVALHEQTHALQFAAAPWLAGHLRARMSSLLSDLGVSVRSVVHAATAARRAERDDADAPGPTAAWPTPTEALTTLVRALRDPTVDLTHLLPPAQRAVVDEVGAVMALLEGHADVTMDAAGRGLVPSVRQLRARFEARRDRASQAHGPARVLRRVLGLDAKLAQYRDGAVFVRAVRRAVGIDGLNAVWTEPALLPSPAEIADPAAWVRRVHG